MGKSYVVTPEMVYGAEWMARHAEELKKWEWEFRPWRMGDLVLSARDNWTPYRVYHDGNQDEAVIILLRRKVPPVPQLREQYGVDRVEIPADKEWTREFRTSEVPVCYLGRFLNVLDKSTPYWHPRLILRDRTPPTRVWFKAEEKRRRASEDDWVWIWNQEWRKVSLEWTDHDRLTGALYLCATRHEEPDLAPTVVTQADVDAAWARQHGGGA